MKKLNQLKLNKISEAELAKREMNRFRGGSGNCSCGCHYANYGGSNECDNDSANYDGGYTSYGGGTPACGCPSYGQATQATMSKFWRGC